MTIRFGSLFTGGGGLDLGLERAGMECDWQVEIDPNATKVLEMHWRNVRRWGDARTFPPGPADEWNVDLICGGDPCPKHGNARRGQTSVHPDLSGYFLAVVGICKPRWVVRENVPAPDVVDFAACLEALGYGIAAFALDARDFTSQSRRRQFVVGHFGQGAAGFKRALLDSADGFGFSATRQDEETPIAACVTAHPSRMAAEDSYCWEPTTYCLTASQGDKGPYNRGQQYLYDGGRLRLLTAEECEGLQGFPRGWTAGFSRSRRRYMLGNAIPVPFAEFIGRLLGRLIS